MGTGRRRLVVALALAAAGGGCIDRPSFRCADADACRTDRLDGVCEASGFCSFADPGCPSGRRYGELAGDLSETCVGSAGDAGDRPDADRAALEPYADFLLGHWPLDEDADDLSDHHHDGTIEGAPDLVAAVVGNGLRLDGAGHFRIDPLAAGEFPTSGTLSFYFRDDGSPAAPGGHSGLFDEFADDRAHLFARPYEDDRLQVAVQNATNDYAAEFLIEVAPRAWHHLVIQWDTSDDELALYLDRELVGNRSIADAGFLPGGQVTAFGVNFVGVLDEIVLYERVLDAGAVAALP
jgi:hypothetical protein